MKYILYSREIQIIENVYKHYKSTVYHNLGKECSNLPYLRRGLCPAVGQYNKYHDYITYIFLHLSVRLSVRPLYMEIHIRPYGSLTNPKIGYNT